MQGDDKLLGIINHYGLKAQLKKLNEEMYELSEAIIEHEQEQSLKELLDIKIVDSDIAKKEHIIEEYADVVLVLSQIGLHFGIDPNEVDKVVDYKVNRTLNKIKEENNEY